MVNSTQYLHIYTQVSVGENRYTCAAFQITWFPYLCHESYLIASVNVFVCAGARPDILNEWKQTPLKLAEDELAKQSDPKRRQQYEKVQESGTSLSCFNTYVALMISKVQLDYC